MAARSRSSSEDDGSRMVPAQTPQARENQLIRLAGDLAERQLRDGTASAMVITHYLKLGSSREVLEQQRIAHENELARAKTELMESQKQTEQLIADALEAMRSYKGGEPSLQEIDYDEYS